MKKCLILVKKEGAEGLLRVSSFMFLVSSYFSVTTPKAAEPSAKAFGRSIVLCTFKVLSIAYVEKLNKLLSKFNKKRCDGLYPYAVSSFMFLVSRIAIFHSCNLTITS